MDFKADHQFFMKQLLKWMSLQVIQSRVEELLKIVVASPGKASVLSESVHAPIPGFMTTLPDLSQNFKLTEKYAACLIAQFIL